MAFHLEDATHVNWPGVLPWRSSSSNTGYPTREAAESRRRVIVRAYNAKRGTGGPDLRVVERATLLDL